MAPQALPIERRLTVFLFSIGHVISRPPCSLSPPKHRSVAMSGADRLSGTRCRCRRRRGPDVWRWGTNRNIIIPLETANDFATLRDYHLLLTVGTIQASVHFERVVQAEISYGSPNLQRDDVLRRQRYTGISAAQHYTVNSGKQIAYPLLDKLPSEICVLIWQCALPLDRTLGLRQTLRLETLPRDNVKPPNTPES